LLGRQQRGVGDAGEIGSLCALGCGCIAGYHVLIWDWSVGGFLWRYALCM
jgi:hypothetical protein